MPAPRRHPSVRAPAPARELTAAPPALVVVTGPPAAGKTFVAGELRAGLGFPLVAKDTLKETLGEALGVTGRAESQRLGGAVFDVLALVVHELLGARVSTIAEGNLTASSRLWRDLPPCRLCQVHVSAAPETLRTRLRGRDTRHPVHYDREVADEIAARAARGDWDALELEGALVRIDTTAAFPDAAALVAEVGAALGLP